MNAQSASSLMAIAVASPQADGARDWFSLSELAELALPGLPADKRSLTRRARDENWRFRTDANGEMLSRPRIGRGGGEEFHISLLPGAARLELAARGLCATRPEPTEAESPAAQAWRWYDAQSSKVKAEAERRVRVVADVDVLHEAMGNRTAAVSEAAARHGVGKATLWNWLKLIDGVAKSDRLPALAPHRRGGGREAEIDAEIWRIFKSDYLRLSEPTLAICYENTAAIAAERGLSMPSERTIRRRLEQDVDPRILLRLRKGKEASRRSLPAQRRTVDHLHALECVNIDGHTFDVRVTNRDGKVVRPILVGIQDVRSSKLLAWRVVEVESAQNVRLVFADLFEKWGIPVHCVLDNGRGFASKWITGGVPNRFRFKVMEGDPVGLIVDLGIQHHWAIPFRGQSKPIERAWMDLTNRIAKSAFVEGAYTGRNTTKKPENYGSRAIPWDEFSAFVDQQIGRHNAKLGRRGRDYKGRSFDDVFAESYASATIKKATPEQLRKALLAAENKLVNSQTGEVALFGNRYWSEACGRLHGQRVTVRFDPDDLTKPVHLYDLAGRYLCSAPLFGDEKFLTREGAVQRQKLEADARRKVREGIEAEGLLRPSEVAALQVGAPVPEPTRAGAVRMMKTTTELKSAAQPQPQARASQARAFTALGKLKLVE